LGFDDLAYSRKHVHDANRFASSYGLRREHTLKAADDRVVRQELPASVQDGIDSVYRRPLNLLFRVLLRGLL
jgi:hypothetical protein